MSNSQLGAPTIARLTETQAEAVRKHVDAGRRLYGISAIDQGLFEIEIAKIAERTPLDDENAFFFKVFSAGRRAVDAASAFQEKSSGNKNKLTLSGRQKIDDAMRRPKLRLDGFVITPSMSKRQAAMLLRSIMGLRLPGRENATDSWHVKTDQLLEKYKINLYDGVSPTIAPPIFLSPTSIEEFLAVFDRLMLSGDIKSKSTRDKAISVLRKYLRANSRRMATGFCELALHKLEGHGIRHSTAQHERASEFLGTLLDLIVPVRKGIKG